MHDNHAIPSLWDEGQREKAVAHLRRRDRVMRRIVDAVGPLTLAPPTHKDCFGSLCEAIIYQQLAGSAAASIARRFLGLFNDGLPDGKPEKHADHAFPDAARLLATDEATLRSAGLSGPKINALRNLSRAVVEGDVPIAELPRMDDHDIRECLTRVKGIGPWTTQMLLIFHLGRKNVLPVGDLGVRKAASLAYGLESLPSPAELEALAQPWRPYCTAASWYLWRSLGTVTIE